MGHACLNPVHTPSERAFGSNAPGNPPPPPVTAAAFTENVNQSASIFRAMLRPRPFFFSSAFAPRCKRPPPSTPPNLPHLSPRPTPPPCIPAPHMNGVLPRKTFFCGHLRRVTGALVRHFFPEHFLPPRPPGFDLGEFQEGPGRGGIPPGGGTEGSLRGFSGVKEPFPAKLSAFAPAYSK